MIGFDGEEDTGEAVAADEEEEDTLPALLPVVSLPGVEEDTGTLDADAIIGVEEEEETTEEEEEEEDDDTVVDTVETEDAALFVEKYR